MEKKRERERHTSEVSRPREFSSKMEKRRKDRLILEVVKQFT